MMIYVKICLGFLILYFIYTPLLVIIHIPYTQKWAAGYNPPLRFGGHRMMDGFIYCKCFICRKYNKVNMNICMAFCFV